MSAVDQRIVLQAIVEGADPRITPSDRLRAMELLTEMGGPQDEELLHLMKQINETSDDALVDLVQGYMGDGPLRFEAAVAAEVERRLPELVGPEVERRVAELRASDETRLEQVVDARARELAAALQAEHGGAP